MAYNLIPQEHVELHECVILRYKGYGRHILAHDLNLKFTFAGTHAEIETLKTLHDLGICWTQPFAIRLFYVLGEEENGTPQAFQHP